MSSLDQIWRPSRAHIALLGSRRAPPRRARDLQWGRRRRFALSVIKVFNDAHFQNLIAAIAKQTDEGIGDLSIVDAFHMRNSSEKP